MVLHQASVNILYCQVNRRLLPGTLDFSCTIGVANVDLSDQEAKEIMKAS